MWPCSRSLLATTAVSTMHGVFSLLVFCLVAVFQSEQYVLNQRVVAYKLLADNATLPIPEEQGTKDEEQESVPDEEGTGDEEQGSGDEDQGSGDEKQGSGDEDQGSGDEDQGSGDEDQGSGDEDQGSGDEDQGSGDEKQGSGDEDQGSGDEGQGSGDEDQGSGDEDQGSGDEDQGSGDEDQGSGDEKQGSGDEDQGSGDEGQGSGDEDQGSGDEDQGSGDEDQGSGDEDQGSGDEDQGSGDENERRRREFDRENCEKKYLDLYVNHTMCLVDVGTAEPTLTDADKAAIVKQHNDYRKNVQPTASNMLKLIWDDSIAEGAAKWARHCVPGHDGGLAHSVPELPKVYIGQNAGYGMFTFHEVIRLWHAEVKDYIYGVGAAQRGQKVGHYTQVVSSDAIRIGCGAAHCPNSRYYSKKHFICNYAVGQGSFKMPYKRGRTCGACPNSCSDKLCDCAGKLCLNGGKLDINTCTCSCPTLYKGDVCENLNCPKQDGKYCNRFEVKSCRRNLWVRKTCPQLCGICPKACDGLRCKNLGKLNVDTCTCKCRRFYSGKSCEILTCPARSSWWCSRKSPTECKTRYGVAVLCPVLCGKC